MELFWLLAPDRPLGMGCAGGIPTLSIMSLAGHSGMSALDFLMTIREMDAVYLAHLHSKKS